MDGTSDLVLTEIVTGYCHICGINDTVFSCFEPIDFPCRRNTFECSACGSCGRNRHIAQAILDRFPTQPASSSLEDFASHFTGIIWQTCTSGAIAQALSRNPGFIGTEYIDNIPSGGLSAGGVRCEDIQRSSFPDNSVDLIITEDVLEHVPEPEVAFKEIRRVLKPGGFHIGTIPVNWGRDGTVSRAVFRDGELIHLLPPEYHGDPTRPEGILAFTEYGLDIVDKYCRLIGPSVMLSAHLDREQETNFAIYNNWVFVSQKA